MNYKILENVHLASNGMIFDENMNLLKLSRLHDLVYLDKIKYSNTVVLPEAEYVDLTHYYSFWPFAHRYDSLSRIRFVEHMIDSDAIFLLGNISSMMTPLNVVER